MKPHEAAKVKITGFINFWELKNISPAEALSFRYNMNQHLVKLIKDDKNSKMGQTLLSHSASVLDMSVWYYDL
jgi:hypothetical protein